jgi:hypothetical protein
MGTTLEEEDKFAVDEANGITSIESEIICCFNISNSFTTISIPVHFHATGHGYHNRPFTQNRRIFFIVEKTFL